MTITKRITKTEEVEIKINLPFFGKKDREFIMLAATDEEDAYGIRVWKSYNDSCSTITSNVNFRDVDTYEQCDAEEFWSAYNEIKLLSLASEAKCRELCQLEPADHQ